MREATKYLPVVALAAALVACTEEKPLRLTPEVAIDAARLDFGAVRRDTPVDLPLVIHNRGRASLSLTSITIADDPDAPGGAAAFAIANAPETLVGLEDGTVTVRFTPADLADHAALVVIQSDDPNHPELDVRVAGRGAIPVARVVPECSAPCHDTVATEKPPALDFGPRPALRKNISGGFINEPAWPAVTISNEGDIPLALLKVSFEGDAAFGTKTSLNTEGVKIVKGNALTVPVTFNPNDPAKKAYTGELVIQTDDAASPEIRVRLAGQLAPNLPPKACAAIVAVDRPDGAVDYPLDAGGMRSFGAAVTVEPGDRARVYLSAFTDHFKFPHANGIASPPEMTEGDQSLCTTDPEDGRAVLTYKWTVVGRPMASNPSVSRILGDGNPECSFKPDAIGRYKIQLDVTDPQGATATPAVVEFEAVPQRDLIVQLNWPNQPNIDLDVHLVRPAKNCAPKADCVFDKVGDINGYMNSVTSGVFEWGQVGAGFDNPRLDFDDQGDKGLIESVSLNHPENDPECQHARCTYDVYVHYFKDWRASSPSAPKCPGLTNGASCREGEDCGCSGLQGVPAGAVCVSSRCVAPVSPSVKVFVKPTPSRPDPVLSLPVITGTPPAPVTTEKLAIAGPCFLWHVARITWPSQDELATNPNATVSVSEVGTAENRTFGYYGQLASGSFSCSPNSDPKDPDPTFLPGTIPTYR